MKLEMKRSDALIMRGFLSIFFLGIILFARQAFLTNTYIWLWDLSITFALAILVYLLRNKLRIGVIHYVLFLFALSIHDLGVYGMYTKTFLGLNYDNYTHFFGSFAIAMILFNWIEKTKAYKFINNCKVSKVCTEKTCSKKTAHLEYKQRTFYTPLSLSSICFITILIVLGISAIHETIEFLGYTYLNADGPNLFFPGNVATTNIAVTNLTNLMPTLTAADIGASGSYQNTMIDILYNAIGAVAGCVVMTIRKI